MKAPPRPPAIQALILTPLSLHPLNHRQQPPTTANHCQLPSPHQMRNRHQSVVQRLPLKIFYQQSFTSPPELRTNNRQPPSTTVNHRQPPSTTVNHRQPPSTTVNHRQPPSTTVNHRQPLPTPLSPSHCPPVPTPSLRNSGQTTVNHRQQPSTTVNHCQLPLRALPASAVQIPAIHAAKT
jgi:type IV secretory pathway VirB10-like protein